MSRVEGLIRSELSQMQLASLATICGGVPWTRYVMIGMDDDEMLLRCATFLGGRKVEQIRNNPQVHLCCGVSSVVKMKPYLQIQAVAKISTAESQRHRFWNPALASIFKGPDDPEYAVVLMLPFRIEYWVPSGTEPAVWRVREQLEVQQFLEGSHPLLAQT
jgi:general stress protein 26